MNIKILAFLLIGAIGVRASAQLHENQSLSTIVKTPGSFLFSESTLTPQEVPWSLNYSTSYGEKVATPFGYEGIGQQVGIKGYLGKKFTLFANAAFGFPQNDHVTSAQQAEIIRDFIGGKNVYGLRLGAGLGMRRDYSSVMSLLSRITVSYDAPRWKAGGNILLEKAFAENRDGIDIISSLGFQYRLLGQLYGGFETVGEDLEGFFDPNEAEGGAKLMVGPSLNMTTNNSRLSFAISGGPVIYATQNQISNPLAMRELPSQSGLTLRAKVIFNLAQ